VKILVTGAGGQVGRELCELVEPHHDLLALTSAELDIADRERVLQLCGEWGPQLVINAAAFTKVDACESDLDAAFRVNSFGPRNLAEGARLAGAHMVHLSTDYVFDGRSPRPYVEWDQPNPMSVYGLSKLGGEREVLGLLPGATVVRTSWVCGRFGANMVKTVLRLAEAPGQLRFVDDQRGCPTFADDLAATVLRLAIARIPGVFHVTNQGDTTWYGFVRDILSVAGYSPERVEAISTAEMVPARPAPRPANSVLDNAGLRLAGWPLLPAYQEALARNVAWLNGPAGKAGQ
jgi:dTDP-4-dehydrorhamnose reductase